jgi:hypothetical protein
MWLTWVCLLITSTVGYFEGLKPERLYTEQSLVGLTNIDLEITKSISVVRPGVSFSCILLTIHKVLL